MTIRYDRNNIMTMTDAERHATEGGHPAGDCEDCGTLHTPWSAHYNDDGSAAFAEPDGPLTIDGWKIGHACHDCMKLTVQPGYVQTSGPHYVDAVRFTAGHGSDPDDTECGAVDIPIESLPGLIARLQAIYDRQQAAGNVMVDGWPEL